VSPAETHIRLLLYPTQGAADGNATFRIAVHNRSTVPHMTTGVFVIRVPSSQQCSAPSLFYSFSPPHRQLIQTSLLQSVLSSPTAHVYSTPRADQRCSSTRSTYQLSTVQNMMELFLKPPLAQKRDVEADTDGPRCRALLRYQGRVVAACGLDGTAVETLPKLVRHRTCDIIPPDQTHELLLRAKLHTNEKLRPHMCFVVFGTARNSAVRTKQNF
jgi:hypothetical protein